MHIKRMAFKSSLFLLIVFLPQLAQAWSSQNEETARGYLGTHQFMCEGAHVRFIDHPAAQFYDFPSIKSILFFSGVNLKQQGEGPDNPNNSAYADHWYNPLTKKGTNPIVTEAFYKNLVKDLRDLACVDESDIAKRRKIRNEAARNAAYCAHYIQDMTCSFHLVGMPKDEVSSKPGGILIGGPFRMFDEKLWNRAVRESNKDTDRGSNWFDPNYYDGVDLSPGKLSSHVLYEALVELNYYYRNIPLNRGLLWNALRTDYAQRHWKNGMPVRDYVHKIAYEVRTRLDNLESGLYFDSTELQKQFQKTEVKLTEVMSNELRMLFGKPELFSVPRMNNALQEVLLGWEVFTSLMSPVPRPSREWAQAIQASYVLWRASFSATAVKKKNIMLVKIPDELHTYKVKVKVSNLDPDDAATNVVLTYRFKDKGPVTSGGTAMVSAISPVQVPGLISRLWYGDGSQVDLDTDTPASPRQNVPSSDSDWVEIPGTIRVEGDLHKSDAVIRFAVKATYNTVPDSGMSVVQYKVKDLETDAKKLPDFRHAPRVAALNALGVLSRNFKVEEKVAEAAPEPRLEHSIKDQNPPRDTWVSPTDRITLWTYNASGAVPIKGHLTNATTGKPVSGAAVEIWVAEYRRVLTTDGEGRFETRFTVTPDIVNRGMPFNLRVNQPGYAPYQAQFPRSDQVWDIRLRPNVETKPKPPVQPYIPTGTGRACPEVQTSAAATCDRVSAPCQGHMDCPGCSRPNFQEFLGWCTLHPSYQPMVSAGLAEFTSEIQRCVSAFVSANDFGRVYRGRDCQGAAQQKLGKNFRIWVEKACAARCAEDGRSSEVRYVPHRCICK